jgi:hypothetical protein
MDPVFPSSNSSVQSSNRLEIQVPIFVPLIIGVSFVIASAIGAYSFFAVHSLDNVLTVTGSAKTTLDSDTAEWMITFEHKMTETNIPKGYPLLAKDLEVIRAFLKTNNIPDEAVTVSPPAANEIYNYNQNGNAGPREFSLTQTVTIRSKDAHAIDNLSKRISELVDKGVFVSGNTVSFYVSNLAELRVSLLADAVKDAKARAAEIAKAGDKKVGALKAASSGVVQVLPPNSVEVSDYGSYDTSSLQKEVMVTARATFFVR